MVSFATATWRAAVAGRWTARIVGTLAVLFILAFVIGEGPPSPARLTTRERLLFLGLATLSLGLLLAWFRPLSGGLVSIAGWVFFSIVERAPQWDAPFSLLAAMGLMHVLCWWRLRGPAPQTEPLDPAVRNALKLAGGFLAGLLTIFLLLCANEIFGDPPLMTPRTRPPDGMVGLWEGRSVPGDVEVVIGIDSEGAVSGTIGNSAVRDGRVRRNRSWFGRLMNWRAEYQVRGAAGGNTFVAPLTFRGTDLHISLFLRGQRVRGPLHVTLKKRLAA